jgi:hypothetical protein
VRILTAKIFGNIFLPEWFINYISPFIVLMSANLLLLFKDIEIKKLPIRDIIILLSSFSFSVYIIHEQKIIFDYVLKDSFVFLDKYDGLSLVIGILLSILIIYLLCTVIDWIRKYFFKLFKIDDFIIKLGNKIDGILNTK